MWISAALVVFALASLKPRPARADVGDALAVVVVFIIAAGSVAAAADSVLLVHDSVVAAEGGHPSSGWSYAEIGVTAPQVALFGALSISESKERYSENIALFPAMLTGAMFAHGIWSLAEDPEAPNAAIRFLGSGMVGMNGMLTLSALSALGNDQHVFPRWMGITEVALTLPEIAIGASAIALDAEHRPMWGAFTAWSGVLLAHGVASIALGWDGEYEAPSSSAPSARSRVRPLRPRILGLGPAPLMGSDGRAPGVGFVLRGSL